MGRRCRCHPPDELFDGSRGNGDDGFIVVQLPEPADIAAVEFVTRSMGDGSAVTERYTVTVDGGDPFHR